MLHNFFCYAARTETEKLALVMVALLLFSAHISYGKGKYSNQTGFFTKFAKNYCLRNMKKYIHRIQLT